ncbi:hypothetical protein [Flavobacterium gelatinilyticum]|uniref:hypothetical protein n=1 Tax=Flavobacterium gelatinilyticum TaxID=3003260 RepID=UPI002480B946|nr:hypothetical protein [Flavobacterium gelatinilyticum]
MKLLIRFLFLLFINYSFSQDYRQARIIFNDSSSIEGFGEIKGNTIYFKVLQEDKADKWSYDFAKGLTFAAYGFSEKYEYVKIEHSKPKLMQVVEEGKVTLYRDAKIYFADNRPESEKFKETALVHLPNTHSDKLFQKHVSSMETMTETFYVKRENEEFATDIIFSFNIRAKKYFADCKKVIEKIKNKKFTKKNIQDMVFFYNEYCDEDE